MILWAVAMTGGVRMLSWNIGKRTPAVTGRGGCSLESTGRSLCSAFLTMALVLVLQVRHTTEPEVGDPLHTIPFNLQWLNVHCPEV